MIKINEVNKYFDKEIVIQGFVDNIRNLQYVQFVILRDDTGKVQMTIEKEDEKNKELVSIIDSLSLESTLKVKCIVKEAPKVKLGGVELIPLSIEVTSTSLSELPIDLKFKDNSLRETRLDYRFLDLRRTENNLLFKCQSYIESMMREYWYNNGYVEIHTPKISAKSAESGAEQFKLDYFGEEAVLSQSPQFYKQMAMASNFGKVFEIGPVFRAENSHTSYHATEILMLDAEISWIDSYEDVMDEEENWIRYFMTKLKEKYGEEIKNVYGVEVSDVSNKFPRISFEDAKKIIKDEYNYVGEKDDDLERKEEELICKYVKKKYNSDFVFITNFPYGCPPHGGFGVGLGRIMMQIFEIDNIREATFIYRGPTRLNP